MTAKHTLGKKGRTGALKVRPAGEGPGGGRKWVITDQSGATVRELATSESSATAIDSIIVKHLDALKRLAEK